MFKQSKTRSDSFRSNKQKNFRVNDRFLLKHDPHLQNRDGKIKTNELECNNHNGILAQTT